MWRKKIEHFPFGAKGVRLLLMARGFGGFFGVFGMYYSLLYLPLADTTVITFLSPVIACAACAYIIKEPFTRMEQVAAFLSLVGVVLIARPTAIFSYFQGTTMPTASGTPEFIPTLNATKETSDAGSYANVTPAQQTMAVGVAMVGVLGGATVITTLRWIGKRAHPLITVNYFATWVVVVSGISSALIPSIGFSMPSSLSDWGYLLFLGTCGFTAVSFGGFCKHTDSNLFQQFLGAAGLQYEKSSRATNMIYTQMLFALAMDKLIFGHSPELLSIIGSSMILGSAIYVAVRKESSAIPAPNADSQLHVADEERGLVDGMDAEDGDSEEIPMREVITVRTV
jgi:drug/metabolite transporter (DMT)-like permease